MRFFSVRTSAFQAAVMQICTERSDTWAHTVRGRHEFAEDVLPADATYHQVCSRPTNFRTSKQLPHQERRGDESVDQPTLLRKRHS